MAVIPAWVQASTASLQWAVANTSFYVPAGTVLAGGGTLALSVVVQAGVTCVEAGAADPFWTSFQAAFTPLSVAQLTGPGGGII